MKNSTSITPNILKLTVTTGLVLFCAVILSLTLHGLKGNPTATELNTKKWSDEGPLELSPERGRYALTYSLFEDKSYQFSDELGKFAAPDVAEYNGRFVSLFAPTLSYLVIPGYMLGKQIGLAQVGSFAIIAAFAILNFLLIRAIAIKLKARTLAANIAGLIYLFASPAFAYAGVLYQHHVSTFLILLSIYVLLKFKNLWALAVVWFCCALSISVDNPNLFLMFPIGIFAIGRYVHIEEKINELHLKVHFLPLITIAIMALPIAFFMNFNKQSYGNPLQLSGTVATAKIKNIPLDTANVIAEKVASASGAIKPHTDKNALSFFQTRDLPNGFYEHFLSVDRGIFVFTPIMLFGVFGMFVLVKMNKPIFQLLLAVIGINIVLYSMWGDPYGGWAFGSRYLIPSYAILSIFIALALTKFRKNILFLVAFLVLLTFSVSVNTIGALTSNRNPPKPEILALEALTKRQERYSFDRNMQMLDSNQSKSFVFRETEIRKYLTAWQFTGILAMTILTVLFVQLGILVWQKEK